MRRLVTVLVLLSAMVLSGCGRETSVKLGDGSLSGEAPGERSMEGDPDDTLGGPEPGQGEEAGDPDTPVSSAPSGAKSTAPAPSRTAAPAGAEGDARDEREREETDLHVGGTPRRGTA